MAHGNARRSNHHNRKHHQGKSADSSKQQAAAVFAIRLCVAVFAIRFCGATESTNGGRSYMRMASPPRRGTRRPPFIALGRLGSGIPFSGFGSSRAGRTKCGCTWLSWHTA